MDPDKINRRERLKSFLHKRATESELTVEDYAADLISALRYMAEPKSLDEVPPPKGGQPIQVLLYFPPATDQEGDAWDETWTPAIYYKGEMICNDPRAEFTNATFWLPWPSVPR